MSSLFRSRTAAVVAGAVVLVGLGSAGGAYAAGQLDSSDIKNNSVRGVDVQNGSVAWKDLNGVTQRNFNSKASDTEVNGIKHRVEKLEGDDPALANLESDGTYPGSPASHLQEGDSSTGTSPAHS